MNVIVTGAAGFAGIHLTKHLAEHGYNVYAVVRRGSDHNKRVDDIHAEGKIRIVEIDDSDFDSIPGRINEKCEYFFHMAHRPGGRNDEIIAYSNVEDIKKAVKAAKGTGCRRFIGVGSQAEYGVVDGLITEDRLPAPFSMYGAAKVAECIMSRTQSQIEGLEWVWGRIFSLIGEYEPKGRLIPDLVGSLKHLNENSGKGENVIRLSAATQYWDYLDAGDCAEAFIALAEKGKNGEIYNVANGDYHPLKYYTEILKDVYAPGEILEYGEESNPRVTLMPSVQKINEDTGWRAKIKFNETIKRVYG